MARRPRAQTATSVPTVRQEERDRPTGTYVVARRAVPDTGHIKALKDFNEQKQLPDPFKGFYNTGTLVDDTQLLPPPYNLASLIRLPKENNILKQCIDAMVTNTVGHGYRLAYVGPDGEEESPAAKEEKKRLETFLDHVNDEMGLLEVIERVKTDKETIGFGIYEIGRGADNKISTLYHAPAHTFRMTLREADPIEITVEIPRDGQIVRVKTMKRFCRWVQMVGNRKVFFKEMGDPRRLSRSTGKYQKDTYTVADDDLAGEVLVDALYSPGEAYGLPRWIGQMPSVLGSREAELTNLDFFKENAVPAMAVLVAGGLIPQSTLDEIYNLFSNVRGRKAQNRVVVIEAEGDHRAASVDGTMPVPKIEIKSLANERQKDALFKEYGDTCLTNVRSAFRIPSVFTGHAQDYTYASAKTSFEVADSQVFAPERNKTDDLVRFKFLAGFQPKFWTFRLQPPRITDPEEVIRALKNFDGIGAMTPNIAIEMVNEYFDLEIAQVKEVWGDYPFEIVKLLVQQGRLKGMEDVADKLAPAGPTSFANDDPNKGPGRPDDNSDTQQDSPGDETVPKSETDRVMWAVRDSLVALRQALKTQAEAQAA